MDKLFCNHETRYFNEREKRRLVSPLEAPNYLIMKTHEGTFISTVRNSEEPTNFLIEISKVNTTTEKTKDDNKISAYTWQI